MRQYLYRACALLLTAAAAAGCQPNVTADPLPAQGGSARYLLLIVHGSGDNASAWPAEMKAAIQGALADDARWDIVAYDWSRYSADKLTASDAGLAIGASIGGQLCAAGYNYEAVQMIGHSVGSFVVQGACDGYRACGGKASVQLTFLDPFTGRGLFDWTYGKRRFGTGADFAEAYVNTDDPVPSTNGRLLRAHNFDVTALDPPAVSGGLRHWWPVTYYRQTVADENAACGYRLSLMHAKGGTPAGFEEFPAGGLTQVH